MHFRANIIWFVLQLICLYEPTVLVAQSESIINKRHYSVEDGLASREVYCALQDDAGFMWLGTRHGLNRFDGKQFKLFSTQNTGLADNRVVQLAKDWHQRLIIVYGKQGSIRYGMKTEVMHTITHQLQTLKEAFPSLPFDENKVVWVANDGEDLCFITSNPIQYWRLNHNGFSKVGEVLTIDDSDTYHSLDINLIPLFKNNTAILPLHPLHLITPQANIPLPGGRFVRFTNQGQILVLDSAGKKKLIGKDGKTAEPLPLMAPEPASNWINADGNTHERLGYSVETGLWLITDSANLNLLNAGEISLTNPTGIYGFYKDRQLHYWVCTSSGLYKISIEKNRFRRYFTKSQLPQVRQTQVRGIAVSSSGQIFANLWADLYQADSMGTQFSYRKGSSILYGLLYHNEKLFAGEYWVKVFPANNNLPPGSMFEGLRNNIWSIGIANDSTLILGCENKVAIANLKTKQFEYAVFKDTGNLNIINTYRMLPVKNNQCWLVAENGLYLLDIPSRTVVNYYSTEGLENNRKLPNLILHDALPDGEKSFWLATKGNGLVYFNTITHQLTFYNTSQGLLSDILYRIEPDNFGRLWISTDFGLSCFDTATLRFENYTTRQGISHNEFNRLSSYKAIDGRLFFGGLDGVNAFNPADFMQTALVADEPLQVVSFSQFSGSNQKIIDRTIELASTGNIQLKPGDKFFIIDFVLLDYREGKRNYAYKLDGIDKEWIQLTDHTLRISGLRHGNYTLRVRGQNTDGKWSVAELVIPVTVEAPIWQQTWFLTLLILTLLIAVWGIFKWRTRQLRLTQQALERTVEKRTLQLKELVGQKDLMMKEIHHRVKNNLQVISGLLELQKARSTNETTRSALEESQNRVLSIAFLHQNLYQHEDLKGVEMKTFIRELTAHISDVLKSPACVVSINEDIETVMLDIETALPLGLILNELLTNSFKYAFTNLKIGKINITLANKGIGNFRFTYSDNGLGQGEMEVSAKSGSLGTRLIHQLSRQLAGSMKYYFENGIRFNLDFSSMEKRTSEEG